ncbi:hypothetical protein CEF21_19945 [Bacillus sp. FJAT-42376]|nr:hypothetical protein CEF21_19945 [Bacillus sp. FJAT-42376]
MRATAEAGGCLWSLFQQSTRESQQLCFVEGICTWLGIRYCTRMVGFVGKGIGVRRLRWRGAACGPFFSNQLEKVSNCASLKEFLHG